MPGQTLLVFKERQLLAEQQCPGAGVIQSREAIFTSLQVEWILGKCIGIASRRSTEDLADVVQGLGPSVGAAHRQLLEQVVGAKLQLQAVVIGVSGVGAGTQNTSPAVYATYVGAGARSDLLRGRARRKS